MKKLAVTIPATFTLPSIFSLYSPEVVPIPTPVPFIVTIEDPAPTCKVLGLGESVAIPIPSKIGIDVFVEILTAPKRYQSLSVVYIHPVYPPLIGFAKYVTSPGLPDRDGVPTPRVCFLENCPFLFRFCRIRNYFFQKKKGGNLLCPIKVKIIFF